MGKEPGPFGVGGGWGWGETDDSKVLSAPDGWGGLAGEGLLRNAGSRDRGGSRRRRFPRLAWGFDVQPGQQTDLWVTGEVPRLPATQGSGG